MEDPVRFPGCQVKLVPPDAFNVVLAPDVHKTVFPVMVGDMEETIAAVCVMVLPGMSDP
jgi:hypothetical protein